MEEWVPIFNIGHDTNPFCFDYSGFQIFYQMFNISFLKQNGNSWILTNWLAWNKTSSFHTLFYLDGFQPDSVFLVPRVVMDEAVNLAFHV